MTTKFNEAISRLVGTDAAIVFETIRFLTELNKKRGHTDDYRDGLWWTYVTHEGLEDYTGFKREKNRRMLKKLLDSKLIIKGCFNKKVYDRTLWYALTDKAKQLLETGGGSLQTNSQYPDTWIMPGKPESEKTLQFSITHPLPMPITQDQVTYTNVNGSNSNKKYNQGYPDIGCVRSTTTAVRREQAIVVNSSGNQLFEDRTLERYKKADRSKMSAAALEEFYKCFAAERSAEFAAFVSGNSERWDNGVYARFFDWYGSR